MYLNFSCHKNSQKQQDSSSEQASVETDWELKSDTVKLAMRNMKQLAWLSWTTLIIL